MCDWYSWGLVCSVSHEAVWVNKGVSRMCPPVSWQQKENADLERDRKKTIGDIFPIRGTQERRKHLVLEREGKPKPDCWPSGDMKKWMIVDLLEKGLKVAMKLCRLGNFALTCSVQSAHPCLQFLNGTITKLHLLLTVWPYTNYLPLLSLRFFACKIEIIKFQFFIYLFNLHPRIFGTEITL